MSTRALIEHILDQKRFVVSGASREEDKSGNKVYRAIKRAGYTVYAVNPNADMIDGDPSYPTLDNVPGAIDVLVTVTPPEITEESILAAGRLHIGYLWMQPGSESTVAFNAARANSMQIVSGGPCIMEAIRQRQARDAEAR